MKLLKLAKFRAEYFVDGSAPTVLRKPLPDAPVVCDEKANAPGGGK